jgi:protein SCO1
MYTPFVAGNKKHWKNIGAALGAMLVGTWYASPALAQRTPPGEVGRTRVNTPINAATDVKWDQKLDNQLTLETPFRDENGKVVPLSTYFGKKPVILVMPFYKCPGMCTNELNGMVDSFKDTQNKYRVGRDFNVLTISINPKEGADLAAAKKREYLDILEQPGAETGWHFLTGEEDNIRKIADEIGFRYKYDATTDQYAHPAGIVILTPEGKVSKYFFNVTYPARDVKLALTEAGRGRIGTTIDSWLLACYHYDPKSGTYGPKVFAIMQVVGISTILLLASFMVIAFRRDAKQPRLIRGGDGNIETEDGAPLPVEGASETPNTPGSTRESRKSSGTED